MVAAAVSTVTTQGLVTAISSVGFPIVMCLIMVYYIQNRIEKVSDAINNNTLVMTKLLERLDKDE